MTELLRLPLGKLLIATLGLGGAAEDSAGGASRRAAARKSGPERKTGALSSTDLPLEGPAVKRAA